MKIGKKNMVIQLTIFCGLVLVVGFINYYSRDLKDNIHKITKAEDNIITAKEIVWLDEVLTQSTRNYIFTKNIYWKNRYDEYGKKLDEKIEKAKNSSRKNLKKILERQKVANDKLVIMEGKIHQLVAKLKTEDALKIINSKEYTKWKEKYSATINQYLLFTTTNLEKTKKISYTKLNNITYKITLISILSFLLVTLITRRFSNIFLNSLHQIQNAIKKYSTGDLNYKIKLKTNDELEELAKSFNHMNENIISLKSELNKKQKVLSIQENAINSTALVVETTPDGKITHVNDQFLSISKFSKDELLGQDLSILNSNYHDKDFFKNLWNTILSGHNWRGTIKNKTKDESFFWLDTAIYPYRSSTGSIEKFVTYSFDITEKMDTFEKLEETNKKYLASSKAKDVFLANMSHELRTPLNGIIGTTELLEDIVNSPKELELVKIISESGKDLHRIVGDILDFSKLNTDSINLEYSDFNLKNLLSECINNFLGQSQNKKIKLCLEEISDANQYVNSDSKKIKQVLYNFLSNAIKFTNSGEVKLTIELSNKNGKNTLIIKVIDSGIGIDDEIKDKIFTPFTQADLSSTKKYQGAGLGLSICSKIAKAFGGNISFKSEKSVGTTFEFKIPIKYSTNIPTPGKQNFKINSQDIRALLVEDNKINQKVASMLLEKFGIKHDCAENGADALEALSKNDNFKKYSFILMDLQMPVMDGIEATKKIIHLYKDHAPPIIALTANVYSDDRKRCFDAGMVDFIPKPLRKAELERVINEYGKKEIKNAS